MMKRLIHRLFSIQLKQSEVAMLCVVIVSFFGLFHLLWMKSGASVSALTLNAQLEKSKQTLAENKTFLEKLSNRSPASVGAGVDEMDKYVLTNDRLSSVINGIVASSRSEALALTKLSLEDQSLESGYKKMLYSVDAEASFIDIGKFLEKLEDAPLLTEIKSININRIDNEMKRCQAHIRLYSYVRVE